jgi:hypothetical protein
MQFKTDSGSVGNVARAAMIATAIVSLSGGAWAQQQAPSGSGARGSPGSSGASSDSTGQGSGGGLIPRDRCQPGDTNPSCTEQREQRNVPSDRSGASSGRSGDVDIQERPAPNPETPITPSNR